jgi:hypothetical protein
MYFTLCICSSVDEQVDSAFVNDGAMDMSVEIFLWGLDTMSYVYNPSLQIPLGGRDQEDCGLGQVKQKVSETPISINRPAWWPVTMIPSMQEA